MKKSSQMLSIRTLASKTEEPSLSPLSFAAASHSVGDSSDEFVEIEMAREGYKESYNCDFIIKVATGQGTPDPQMF
jgi:hypothetical protein